MKMPALPVRLCLVLLAAVSLSHAGTTSLESFLLSPSPDLTLPMKGDLESEVSLLLSKYPSADQTFIQSKIVFTAAAKKALTSSDTPLIISKSNPLAISLQHLLELYICKQHIQEGRLHLETIQESAGEYETREYYTSPTLLAFVLGKDTSQDLQDNATWKKFEDHLKPFGLRTVGIGEHDERVLLQGEPPNHERFNAELYLLLLKSISTDQEQRTSWPGKPPAK